MRQRRRSGKRDLTGVVGLVVLVAVFVGIAFLVASPSSHPSVQTGEVSSRFTEATRTEVQISPLEDAFYGKIVNAAFDGQTTGVVQADTNCKGVGSGLTNCLAIIITANGTEVHFDYTHDMSRQPCLASGDSVSITLLSDGTVKVVRG